jgi:hypothetical protein
MSVVLKPTVNNIINLWFGEDTPIRQYKIKLNQDLWVACQQIDRDFSPPSKIDQVEKYRKSDKVAFAKAVQLQIGYITSDN